MDVPVKIKTKYKRVGDTAVPFLRISVLEDISISTGQVILINPKDPSNIRIDTMGDNIPVPYYA